MRVTVFRVSERPSNPPKAAYGSPPIVTAFSGLKVTVPRLVSFTSSPVMGLVGSTQYDLTFAT